MTDNLLKEQVVEGTPCETSAELLGFELIKPELAFVDVTVSSHVRQIGRTSIAHIVANALKEAGYNNVEVVSADPTPKHFVDNKMPNLKIRVIDQDPRFCWSRD